MNGGYIDLGNPVSDHPINYGLVAWWIALPNNRGGSRWFDITGSGYTGTITGPTWRSGPDEANRDFHGLRFDNTDDYVDIPTGLIMASPMSVVVDAYPFSVPSGTVNHFCGFYQGSGAFPGWGFDCGGSTAGGGRLAFWDGSAWRESNASAVVANKRQVCGVTNLVGTGTSFYVNGNSGVGGTATASSVPSYSGTKRIGSQSGAFHFFDGIIYSVAIWNRALNAAEQWAVWQQTATGYPDMLRRWTRKVYSFGTVAAGGGATLSRRYYDHFLKGAA